MTDRPGQPNFFIVGAAKAGTTYIHSLLSAHPNVCMSTDKEPHFFATTYSGKAYSMRPGRIDSLPEYLNLFPDRHSSTIVGEASPSYLWCPESAQRIHDFNPQAKILILLRDPIERAFSHYLMDIREGVQTLTFEDALAHDATVSPREWGGPSHLYVDLGMYAKQVSRYCDQFPKEQILVIESAHLHSEPKATLARILAFLGLDPNWSVAEEWSRSESNRYARPRGRIAAGVMGSRFVRQSAVALLPKSIRSKVRDRVLLAEGGRPEMSPATALSLQDVYRDDISDLRRHIDSDLLTLTESWI